MGDSTHFYKATADSLKAAIDSLTAPKDENVIKQFVDNAANWFEAIGFLIGIVTVVKVFILDKRVDVIKRKHLFQTRVKQQIKELQDISQVLSTLLTDFNNKKNEIRAQIKTTEIIAESIKDKLQPRDLQRTEELISKAKAIEKRLNDTTNLPRLKKVYFGIIGRTLLTEEMVRQYYITLTGLITSLTTLRKDIDKSIT